MSNQGAALLQKVGELLDYNGDRGASDLHFTSDRGAYLVKDKRTQRIANIPTNIGAAIVESLAQSSFQNGLEGLMAKRQIGASFDQGGGYRGRVALRNEQGGASCTIRIIPKKIPTGADLSLPPVLRQLAARPSGLLLTVGQTGSGKSTTNTALTNDINLTDEIGIYTIESPIEFLYPQGKSLVIQREVGLHVESFAQGVEDAKRSHPRIIVVGEILNTETARSALLAAASGHLVISTMHAGTAGEAVDSFTSMFTPEEQPLVRTQLAQSLIGIVAQQLVPKQGGGMSLAQELALNTPAFADLMRGTGDRGNDTKLIQQYLLGMGTKEGSFAMEYSLARLVSEQAISLEQASRSARDQSALKEKLQQFGIAPPVQRTA